MFRTARLHWIKGGHGIMRPRHKRSTIERDVTLLWGPHFDVVAQESQMHALPPTFIGYRTPFLHTLVSCLKPIILIQSNR
jgi:hypothetical protein